MGGGGAVVLEADIVEFCSGAAAFPCAAFGGPEEIAAAYRGVEACWGAWGWAAGEPSSWKPTSLGAAAFACAAFGGLDPPNQNSANAVAREYDTPVPLH